ncbi:17150_t:CDS:1, partial [Racocetra persica]
MAQKTYKMEIDESSNETDGDNNETILVLKSVMQELDLTL